MSDTVPPEAVADALALPPPGVRTVMVRLYDPAQLTHSKLKEFAVVAAWIATLVESANDLEDLLMDVTPEELVLLDYSTPWPWDLDSFVVALSDAQETREAVEQGLEELVATCWGGSGALAGASPDGDRSRERASRPLVGGDSRVGAHAWHHRYHRAREVRPFGRRPTPPS
jgi:hypothetical protein